jgi:hypothetical protein
MRSHRITIFTGSCGVGKGELPRPLSLPGHPHMPHHPPPPTITIGPSRLRVQSLRRPSIESGHLHHEEGGRRELSRPTCLPSAPATTSATMPPDPAAHRPSNPLDTAHPLMTGLRLKPSTRSARGEGEPHHDLHC